MFIVQQFKSQRSNPLIEGQKKIKNCV